MVDHTQNTIQFVGVEKMNAHILTFKHYDASLLSKNKQHVAEIDDKMTHDFTSFIHALSGMFRS